MKPLKNSPEKLKKINEGVFGPSPPFLIISSLEKVAVGPNDYVYGREYNWGVCNIENPKHCDFVLLYNLLVGHFSLELIRITNEGLMEGFRERYKKKMKKRKMERSKWNQKIGYGIALSLFSGVVVFEYLLKKNK